VSRLPEPIGSEVRKELQRFGPAGALGDLVAAWPKAVGPAIAANAWPARISRDGTLHVSTASSSWAFELTQLASTVLARLGEHLGEACPPALRFAVGPLPEAAGDAETTPSRTVPKAGTAEFAEGMRIAASIEDESLREAVAKAAAASLATRGGRSDDRPI
jgi:hypothetical protein